MVSGLLVSAVGVTVGSPSWTVLFAHA